MSEIGMNSYNIGAKIRRLRHARQLTLQAVAGETGFSPALISQIENNNVSPPIATLAKIARFFNIKMADLFDEEHEQRFELVRADQRRPVCLEEAVHARSYALSPQKQHKKMEPCMVSNSGEQVAGDSHSHAGDEFIFVVKRSAELTFDERTIRLEAGDSIYFDATVNHQLSLANQDETILLKVVGR